MANVTIKLTTPIEDRVAREQLEVIEADELIDFLSETLTKLGTRLWGFAETRDYILEVELNAVLGRVESAFNAASCAITARKPFLLDNEGADA